RSTLPSAVSGRLVAAAAGRKTPVAGHPLPSLPRRRQSGAAESLPHERATRSGGGTGPSRSAGPRAVPVVFGGNRLGTWRYNSTWGDTFQTSLRTGPRSLGFSRAYG